MLSHKRHFANKILGGKEFYFGHTKSLQVLNFDIRKLITKFHKHHFANKILGGKEFYFGPHKSLQVLNFNIRKLITKFLMKNYAAYHIR